MLEHAGEDGLCELVHVFDDEAVTVGAPGDDVGPRGVLEHPERELVLEQRRHGMDALVELLDKVGGGGHIRLALVLYGVLVRRGGR